MVSFKLDRLEFVTPDDVRRRAGKRGETSPCSVIQFAEVAELDEHVNMIGETYNALLAEAFAGEIEPSAQQKLLPQIHGALATADAWLTQVIESKPSLKDGADEHFLKDCRISNVDAWRDSAIQAYACMIAVLENARYSFTRIEGAWVEAGGLKQFQEKVEALWVETSKALAEFQRWRPKT